MHERQPLLIVGFGRSGTTWLSDILSKMSGELCLFEPMHPLVFEHSELYCYYSGNEPKRNTEIAKFLTETLSGLNRHKWLLRNYLATDLSNINPTFVEEVWRNCYIGGMKLIRGNFMIPLLFKHVSPNIVYLRRDPLSVVASIMRRPRFWEEYGWETHLNLFQKSVLDHGYHGFFDSERISDLMRKSEDSVKVAIMWKVTDLVVSFEMVKRQLPIVKYEELYGRPYQISREIYEQLWPGEKARMHPSYIFTPSMLTQRTTHDLGSLNHFGSNDTSFFWNSTIDKALKVKIEKAIDLVEQSVQ